MATFGEQNPSLDPADLQSLAVETLQQTGCSYSTWLRYETKFERQFDRANATWTRYQDALRRCSKQDADIAMKQALFVPLPPLVSSDTGNGALNPPGKSASNVQNASPQHVPAETAAPGIARTTPPAPDSPGLRAAA